jgi:hypothetical protein
MTTGFGAGGAAEAVSSAGADAVDAAGDADADADALGSLTAGAALLADAPSVGGDDGAAGWGLSPPHPIKITVASVEAVRTAWCFNPPRPSPRRIGPPWTPSSGAGLRSLRFIMAS